MPMLLLIAIDVVAYRYDIYETTAVALSIRSLDDAYVTDGVLAYCDGSPEKVGEFSNSRD